MCASQLKPSARAQTPYLEAFEKTEGTEPTAAPLEPLKLRLTSLEGFDPATGVEQPWHYQPVRWTLPEPTLTDAAAAPDSWGRVADVLTPIQVQQWREEGFLLLDGLASEELITSALEQLGEVYPAAASNDELAEAAKGNKHNCASALHVSLCCDAEALTREGRAQIHSSRRCLPSMTCR